LGQLPRRPIGVVDNRLIGIVGNSRRWREERELASWDWLDLGGFAGPKKLEQVWLGLRRHHVHVAGTPRALSTPFAVRVAIRPPRGVLPRLGYLVKGIVDGVVCAFQAHTDRSSVGEVARRVSNIIEATPDEIQTLLVRRDRAVLGVVPRQAAVGRSTITVTALSVEDTLEGRQMCSSTPIVFTPRTRPGTLMSASACGLIAL
jgi:hypothetical protein